VLSLEIALGYQHRGVERLLETQERLRAVLLSESIAGDSVIAHASACCGALEALARSHKSARAQSIRGIALELERLANHIGDLGAIAGDIAYQPGAAYFGRLRGMSRPDAAHATAEWLDRFSLSDRANEPLKALSKGNQQKVQFASTVLHRPRFAILDEPFSGLDPLNQDLFVRTIRELRDGGTTVLLSAHQMQLVERLADRVILLSRGREVLRGTIPELRRTWSAGRKLVVRVSGDADPALLAGHPAVVQVDRTSADELTVLTHDDSPLSDLLVAIGSRYPVTSVLAEELTLHDIYVRSVEASLGNGAGVVAAGDGKGASR